MDRSTRAFVTFAIVFLVPMTLLAQAQRDVVPLRSWPAPLYFQPTRDESRELAKPDTLNALSSDATTFAATPVGSLVFVAMTPCRIADTRDGSYPIGFGPPTLTGNTTRIFDIQSLTSRCPVPSIAQAYSFNITVVPPGATFGNVNPSGALGYLTIWPTGVAQPVVSTLNSYLGTVVANAAIVPAGTGGAVNVFVVNNTDFILDINGYYAPQSGITVAQGSAGAPSLSFAGDAGTGIFSSGVGNVSIATGGTSRLSVSSNGPGGVGIGMDTPQAKLHIAGAAEGIRVQGNATGDANNAFITFYDAAGTRVGYVGDGSNFDKSVALDSDGGDVVLNTAAGRVLTVTSAGVVGIGITNPNLGAKLHVEGGAYAVYGHSESGVGVVGNSNNFIGVRGFSTNSSGVEGSSTSGYGVYGQSSNSYAGFFLGNVVVSGCVSASNISCPSDVGLKENITSLSYGLPEVLRLRPVTWQWKDPTRTELNLGLIAQEVEPVLPELILQNADNKGSLGLNYMGLIPVLIKGMQEQQAQIETQQEQNRKLEERLAALEKLLSTMPQFKASVP